MSAQVQPAVSSLPPGQTAKLWQAAQDFEAMAIGQLLQPMFQTVDAAHSAFGGGEAEAAWRPMLVDAIGKQMARHGASASPCRCSTRCCVHRSRQNER